MNPQHRDKINELIDNFSSSLRVEAERLYRSGGVDVESFNPDEYVLAKILVTAAIENMKHGYAPFHSSYKKDVENLTHM